MRTGYVRASSRQIQTSSPHSISRTGSSTVLTRATWSMNRRMVYARYSLRRRSMETWESIDVRLAVGEPHGNSPVMLICPFHNDDVGSLAVYSSNIHCFGCGVVGEARTGYW